MEGFEFHFKELRDSVRQGIRDHSLAVTLRKKVEEIRLESSLVQAYSENLFRLYDFSNSPAFVSTPPNAKKAEGIVLDPLAISIKGLVLRMLASLVAFFNDNPHLDLPHSLLFQALQVMIMVSRVLLDVNQASEVRSVYSLVITFHEAIDHALPDESQVAHWVNIVELCHLDVDSRKIDIQQYRKAMQEIIIYGKKSEIFEGYLQFCQHLTMEVVLKLLKKGLSAQAKALFCFLPEKMLKIVKELVNVEGPIVNEEGSGFKMSPFYELYVQIKNNGIQNVAEENLRMFLRKEQNFNDPRLFDVVALTGALMPLQIWFQIHLNSKTKSQQIHTAYRCFIYMIQTTLQQANSQQSDVSMSDSWNQKRHLLSQLLNLSKIVLVSLLGEKKDNIDPIFNIVKRLSKLLIQAVISLHPNHVELIDFIDKLMLICGKYGLNEVGRSVTCVGFYYELIMGIASEESFGKFCKTNLLDKGSELFKTLKIGYQFRAGKQIPESEQQQLLKKEPFLMLLFAKQPQEQFVLRITPQQFSKLKQKWQVYLFLLQGDLAQDQSKMVKTLNHMQETILYSDWSEINRMDISYIQDLINVLMKLLSQNSQRLQNNLKSHICVALLYFSTFKSIPGKLSVVNGSILLNRYSKLLKLLSVLCQELPALQNAERAQIVEMHLYLGKLFLCTQLQTLKKLSLSGQVVSETGLLVMIDLLNDFVQKYEENLQTRDFFKFVRFEILCLTDSVPENDISYEQNAKLLKLYCSSRHIKKQLKLKIMRKLIREDLVSDSKMLSLSDMSELIQIAEDHQEKSIFASYIMRAFGEQGKKFLTLQSSKDPKSYAFLFEESLEEDRL